MKKNKLLLLLAIGLVLRLVLLFMYQPWNHPEEVLRTDALGYHNLAVKLIEEHTFEDTFRTPGYPFFIAIVYSIFGPNPTIVILLQFFIHLSSVFLLFLIAKNIWNEKVGFIAAILLCFEPDHILFSYELMTETIFVFTILLASLQFVFYIKNKRLWNLIFSTSLFGIATWIRPIGELLPFVLIAILSFEMLINKPVKIVPFIKKSILIIVIFMTVLSPWLIRNQLLFGHCSLASISGSNLLHYNVAFTKKRMEHRPALEINNELRELVKTEAQKQNVNLENPFDESELRKQLALGFIKENKLEYTKSHLLGSLNIFVSIPYKKFLHRFFRIPDYSDASSLYSSFSMKGKHLRNKPFYVTAYGIFSNLILFLIYVISLLGMLKLLIKKRYFTLFAILTIMAYFALITGVIGMARFRVPVSPFYLLTAAFFITELAGKKLRSDKLS